MNWITNRHNESKKDNPFSFYNYFLIAGGFEDYKNWVDEIINENDSNLIWGIIYKELTGDLEYYRFDEDGEEIKVTRNLVKELSDIIRLETQNFQYKFRRKISDSILSEKSPIPQLKKHIELFSNGKDETKNPEKLEYFNIIIKILENEISFLKTETIEAVISEQTMILPPPPSLETILYDYDKIVNLIGDILNDPTFELIVNPVDTGTLKKVFSKAENNLEEKIIWKKKGKKKETQKLLIFINTLVEAKLIETYQSSQKRNKWLTSVFVSETSNAFNFVNAQKDLNRAGNLDFAKKLKQRIQNDFPWVAIGIDK